MENSVTIPVPVKSLPAQLNGHPNRCQCSECYSFMERQFAPFDCHPFSISLRGIDKPCPKCKRQCPAIPRGGWLLWSCWECLHQVAAIVRIIDKGDNSFGFAEKVIDHGEGEEIDEEVVSIYFNFNRKMTVGFDGSDYPTLNLAVINNQLTEGTIIIFQEFVGIQGPKALWWALEDEYAATKGAITCRPLYRFRLRDGREKISRLHPSPNFTDHWEGKNLFELRQQFPKVQWQTFGDYDEHRARYFEYFNEESGTWIACADPR